MVSQHMPSQRQACDPGLTATARGGVLVDLERCGKQAAKVESCVGGGLVCGQGRQVQVEGERVKVLF